MQGETTDFQEFKISSATWVRGEGPSCNEGNDRFQKNQICMGYGVRRVLYARGKTIDIQKTKKNTALGGHKVAKSK